MLFAERVGIVGEESVGLCPGVDRFDVRGFSCNRPRRRLADISAVVDWCTLYIVRAHAHDDDMHALRSLTSTTVPSMVARCPRCRDYLDEMVRRVR